MANNQKPRIAFAAVINPRPYGTEDQFTLGLAEADEPGYVIQYHHGRYATFHDAAVKADELNMLLLGLTPEEGVAIVASSMFASNRRRRG